MKPMKLRLLLIGIPCILLLSCKTHLSTTKPRESYLPLQIESKPSTFAVTVNMDIPKLEKALNSSLKGVIYEDNKIDDDNMMLKVSKISDFKFSVKGNSLSCVLPLDIWVKTRYKKDLLITTVENYYEASGALNLNVSLAFSVEKDWSIKSQTTIDGYKWVKSPMLKVAGVNLPVTMLADLVVSYSKSKITTAVDKVIAKDNSLRQTMTQVWEELQQPMQVDTDYDIWLKMSPTGIVSTPITGTGNQLVLNLGLTGIVETNMGRSYFSSAPKTKLPEYKMVKAIHPDFSVHSNVNVTYHKMEEVAKSMVVGQEYSQGNKKVRVEGVRFYGQDDYLVTQIALSGSVNGSIYCIGKPQFDNATQSLKITNFDFEIDTKGVLLKSANWLMHKSFLKMMEPMLTLSFKTEIEEMLSTTNSMMKNYEIQKGVLMNGQFKNVIIDQIGIGAEAVVISGKMDGNLKIDVGEVF